jgi:hypothetical protein
MNKKIIIIIFILLSRSFVFALEQKQLPIIGVWQWNELNLENDHYRYIIDSVSEHLPYNMLVEFLRFPDYEVTSQIIHQKVKQVSKYAYQRKLSLIPDLDIRNARRSFLKKFPNDMQEMVRMKEVQGGTHELCFNSIQLSDHYTGGNIIPYKSTKSILYRVFCYKIDRDSVVSSTVHNITDKCTIIKSISDSLIVGLPTITSDYRIMVMAGFKYFYPDIFSPNLLDFQRQILKQYNDCQIGGACKDEWGFPPYFPRFFHTGYIDYWYSTSFDKFYQQLTGRSLLDDLFLMGRAQTGMERQRIDVINRYIQMVRERNSLIEKDFYNAVKEYYGPRSFVATHPTWWPFPDKIEVRKNGLDWWEVQRDFAQTDEVTPFAVRTALSKKWNSPVWYNQYYKNDLQMQIWSSALAGGRIDYLDYTNLSTTPIIEAEKKIHLLNFVTKAPLNCKVAVIFGYKDATNWASSTYDDIGMQIIDALWQTGYAADLIPSYEIENGSLKIDSNRYVHYGQQKYDAVVLYHFDMESDDIKAFFTKNLKTHIYVTGKQYPDNNILIQNLLLDLKDSVFPTISPCSGILDNSYFRLRDFMHESAMPPLTGYSRMLDGTYLKIAATRNIEGDPINDFFVDGNKVKVNARGLVSVHFDSRNCVDAMAAGDLLDFEAKGLSIHLKNRQNVALCKNSKGEWKGVVQDGNIPQELKKITSHWSIIK